MWNKPKAKDLYVIPKLYATEHIKPREKIIHEHFFIGGSDWYVCECDGVDTFFGFAILNGDYQNAEWGYFTLSELVALRMGITQVDRDLYWRVRKAGAVNEIAKACGWEADYAL